MNQSLGVDLSQITQFGILIFSQLRDLSINNTASIKPMYYLSDTQAYNEVCAKTNCIVFCLRLILELIFLIDWIERKYLFLHLEMYHFTLKE